MPPSLEQSASLIGTYAKDQESIWLEIRKLWLQIRRNARGLPVEEDEPVTACEGSGFWWKEATDAGTGVFSVAGMDGGACGLNYVSDCSGAQWTASTAGFWTLDVRLRAGWNTNPGTGAFAYLIVSPNADHYGLGAPVYLDEDFCRARSSADVPLITGDDYSAIVRCQVGAWLNEGQSMSVEAQLDSGTAADVDNVTLWVAATMNGCNCVPEV